MKNRSKTVLSFIVIALCIIAVLVALLGAGGSTPRFASQPLQSPIRPTIDVRFDTPTPDFIAEKQKADATLAAEATAAFEALPPQPTPSSITGPATIYDPVNRVSLELPENWLAVVPTPSPAVYLATLNISTYDLFKVDAKSVPKDGIIIDLVSDTLPKVNSFDEWVQNQQKAALAPANGSATAFFSETTEIRPAEFGGFNGLLFDATTQSGENWRIIYLKYAEDKYITITVRPLNDMTKGNLDAAMNLLSTLKPFDKP